MSGISPIDLGQADPPPDANIEIPKAITYADLLERVVPEAKNLTPGESHRLHAQFVMNASDRARTMVESGELGSLSLEGAFHEIARVHRGRNPFELAVSYYDHTVRLKHGDKPNLFGEVLELDELDTPEHDTRGVYGQNLRTRPMRMSRNNGEFIIGVPSRILPEVSQKYFSVVEERTQRHKEEWEKLKAEGTPDYLLNRSWQNIVIFSAAAATMADILHFKGDCNGRISEDFMVEIQRRILGSDTDRIRTWTSDNMRAKGEEGLVKEEYVKEVVSGNECLTQRGKAITPLRKAIMEDFLALVGQKYREGDLGDEREIVWYEGRHLYTSKTAYEGYLHSGRESNDLLLDDLLERQPELIKAAVYRYIDLLEKFDVVKFQNHALISTGVPLINNQPYVYKRFPTEVFIDPAPLDLDEVNKRFTE